MRNADMNPLPPFGPSMKKLSYGFSMCLALSWPNAFAAASSPPPSSGTFTSRIMRVYSTSRFLKALLFSARFTSSASSSFSPAISELMAADWSGSQYPPQV